MKVLIAAGDDDLRSLMRSLLERLGWQVGEAATADDAGRSLADGDFDALVADGRLTGGTGAQLAAATGARAFLLYADLTPEAESEAASAGATALSKSDVRSLIETLEGLLGGSPEGWE